MSFARNLRANGCGIPDLGENEVRNETGTESHFVPVSFYRFPGCSK
jgi:hypothetical protein